MPKIVKIERYIKLRICREKHGETYFLLFCDAFDILYSSMIYEVLQSNNMYYRKTGIKYLKTYYRLIYIFTNERKECFVLVRVETLGEQIYFAT